MFSLDSSAAAEAETFSPSLMIGTGLMISMAPLTILVAMLSAWKKAVCPGSRPVGPAQRARVSGQR
jgi:hypothetical protein